MIQNVQINKIMLVKWGNGNFKFYLYIKLAIIVQKNHVYNNNVAQIECVSMIKDNK